MKVLEKDETCFKPGIFFVRLVVLEIIKVMQKEVPGLLHSA